MNARLLVSACALATALLASDALGRDLTQRAPRACNAAHVSTTLCREHDVVLRLAMDTGAQRYLALANGSDGGNGATQISLANAARAVAAYVVLEHFYPDEQPGLEADLAIALADIPESQAKADALAAGRRAGEAMIARRAP